jgi:hypothetical protein
MHHLDAHESRVIEPSGLRGSGPATTGGHHRIEKW